MAEIKEEIATPLEEVVSETKPEEALKEVKPEAIPKEYEGKTPEELIQVLKDKETELGRRSTEIGTLRDDRDRYRQDAEDQRRTAELIVQQPQPQTPAGHDPYGRPLAPVTPQEPRQFQYENADAEVRRIIQEEGTKNQRQVIQAAVKTAWEEGAKAFPVGRNAAIQKYPELLRGIEREVEDEVKNFYAPQAKQGIFVHQFVADPNTWKIAAENVRVRRGEYEIAPRKGPPVKSTPTETPTSGRTPLSEVTNTTELDWNDPKVRQVMADSGMTKEEVRKVIEEEQQNPTDVGVGQIKKWS